MNLKHQNLDPDTLAEVSPLSSPTQPSRAWATRIGASRRAINVIGRSESGSGGGEILWKVNCKQLNTLQMLTGKLVLPLQM